MLIGLWDDDAEHWARTIDGHIERPGALGTLAGSADSTWVRFGEQPDKMIAEWLLAVRTDRVVVVAVWYGDGDLAGHAYLVMVRTDRIELPDHEASRDC